jgi:hypothetical protein
MKYSLSRTLPIQYRYRSFYLHQLKQRRVRGSYGQRDRQ